LGIPPGECFGITSYSYVYNGSQLTRMTVDTQTTVDGEIVPESHILDFTYDASGNPQTMTCDGVTYYYSVNIQGDVMAILDENGTIMVHYIRQGYGLGYYIVPSNATGSMLNMLNPFGYRGYVRDRETYLYYLESRYYSEALCRFLNADALVTTGQGLLGNNMFAYCQGNPVLYADYSGFILVLADDVTGEQRNIYEQIISYLRKSKRASALIDALEASEVVFTITFTKDPMRFDYTTQTIYLNPYWGVALEDGKSTQSVALGFAHEMGHAAEYLLGVYNLYSGEKYRIFREELNLKLYEIPIATELGEPIREKYGNDFPRYRENPIHFTTVETHPLWIHLLPWNWCKPIEYTVEHNI